MINHKDKCDDEWIIKNSKYGKIKERIENIMKYCTHCGADLHEEAVVCIHCGCMVKPDSPVVHHKDDTLETVVKIMLILGCISLGWMLIPLAWCIPITVTVFKKLNNNEPIETGLKVCALIFVNLIAGVCLLCMEDE